MDAPIFFSVIDTFCPMCREPVRKVVEARSAGESKCRNEFYAHRGDTLVKFSDPVGAWENSKDYLNAGLQKRD